MPTELGEQLTRWTVRIAVALYLARYVIELSIRDRQKRDVLARSSWTCGLIIFLVHVACAFHFYHGWSHQHAYDHTAKQTAATVGINWGGGLWFNYLFTVMWIADVVMWFRLENPQQIMRWWSWTVHAVFAFMMVNATIVFGPPLWRWIGIVVFAVGGMLYWQSRHRIPN